MNHHIVLCTEGAAPVHTLMQALTQAGHSITFVRFGPALAAARTPLDQETLLAAVQLPALDNESRALDSLLPICRDRGVDLVIPVGRVASALGPYMEALEAEGVRVLRGAEEVMEWRTDRWAWIRQLRPTVPMSASQLLTPKIALEKLTYPLWVYPRNSEDGAFSELVHSAEDLEPYSRHNRYTLQAPVEGTDYVVDVLVSWEGLVLALVPQLVYRDDRGAELVARTLNEPRLADLTATVACQLGLTGPAQLAFVRATDGQFRLVDVRIGPEWTGQPTLMSGVNIPALALKDALGEAINSHERRFQETGYLGFTGGRAVEPWRVVFLQRLFDDGRRHGIHTI